MEQLCPIVNSRRAGRPGESWSRRRHWLGDREARIPADQNIGDLWGIRAVYENAQLVREVHRRYAAAGADVLTAATWRVDYLPRAERDGLVEGPPGRGREVLKRRSSSPRSRGPGRRDDRAVAFSLWLEPMELSEVIEMADAVAAARPDFVLVETMETIPDDLEFPGYETLLTTGLPLWVSYRWTARGPSDVRSVGIEPFAPDWQEPDGELFGRAARRWEELGVAAVLVNCLPRHDVVGTLPYLRRFTSLPLGAYPNIGRYLDPGWQHDDSTTPEAYLADAKRWVGEGATIVGGCCGTTPEHIAALAEAFRPR